MLGRAIGTQKRISGNCVFFEILLRFIVEKMDSVLCILRQLTVNVTSLVIPSFLLDSNSAC